MPDDQLAFDPYEDEANLMQEQQETESVQQNWSGSGSSSEGADDSSVLSEFLTASGISDPSKIKFDDGSGNVVDRDWSSLSKDEKLGILDSTRADDSTQLTDEEINLINAIRDSRMNPSDYINAVQSQAANAANMAVAPVYEIDGISDDELYVLDALDKYGEENVTDEQLEKLLNDAKSDEELYNKTIASLRVQYKNREDELKLQQQQQYEMQQEQDFANFQDSILNEIESLNNIAGLPVELTTNDMNELANFILTRDDNGNSAFGMAMNDPRLFTQMAFWALKGNDIMKQMSDELAKSYSRGVSEGKKGQSSLAFNTGKKSKKTDPVAEGFALDIE